MGGSLGREAGGHVWTNVLRALPPHPPKPFTEHKVSGTSASGQPDLGKCL